MSARVSSPVLVGRQREREHLRRVLKRAADGPALATLFPGLGPVQDAHAATGEGQAIEMVRGILDRLAAPMRRAGRAGRGGCCQRHLKTDPLAPPEF
jgi:hypothetical protein